MTDVKWFPETLPDGWRVARMIDHVRLVNGYPFDSALFTANQGTPLVRIRDLGSATTEVCFAGDPVPEAEIDRGAVLVGMDGDFNVARWAGGKALLNQRVCCLTPHATLDPAFLAFVLPAPLKIINDLTGSTTVKHLSSFDIQKIRFPLPPPNIQVRIGTRLESITGRIDNLVATKQRLLDLLAEKRKAIIATAVTRGLDPKVKLRDSGVPWLGEIPGHWDVTRLKFVARVQTGIALGKSYSEATVELPYLRVANVQDGFIDLTEVKTMAVPEREAASATLRKGDVLMNEGGDADKLGRGSIWDGSIDPCLHQNHVFALRPESVTSDWLSTWTGIGFAKSYFETRAKQSTNLASISSTNLLELPIAIPPDDEQRVIVEHISRETVKLDAVRAATERTIALLKERRAALIAAAVTGQLDVGAEA